MGIDNNIKKYMIMFFLLVNQVVFAANPIVESSAITSVNEDGVYSYIVKGSDADDDNLTWSVKSGTTLPSWLSLNSSSFWEQVGSAGFSEGEASYTSIVFDSSNTPYVVYRDAANSYKANVMKFDGSAWVQVGTAGFSAGQADFTSIALDSSDIPYVVYRDAANSYKASVMKFNGSAWEQVGMAGFSAAQADYTSIVFDNSNTPYVTYRDKGNDDKASVMKFNGSAWEQVGSEGFSAGQANYTSIAFDSSNTPYVTYQDGGNNNKASVMKFNGTTWEQVGSAGFSAAQVDSISIVFDSSDTPYVAYKDSGNSDKANVMKFNGSAWEQVGTAGFSAGQANYTSIAIDSSDTPYVVYKDHNNSYKASVMRYNGTSWEQVGSAGFSSGTVQNTSIAIDDSGIPYMTYTDSENASKASVMKFNSGTTLSGTPTSADFGEHNISLILSDGVNEVEHNFTITVHPLAPTVTSTAVLNVNEDSPYSYILSGSDAQGDSLIWSVKSGTTLPSWLSLNTLPTWENVGSVGFSAGTADDISIAFDSSNTPYVVYKDNENAAKASVMKFNGSAWEPVGSAGFSAGQANFTSIALDSSGTPYVVYKDHGNSSGASVMKFNGSTWEQVGIEGFSAGQTAYTSIAFDSSDTPYVVYKDYANANKASVMKFNGSTWEQVGTAGFSAGQADFTSIAFDSSNTPYVVYRDLTPDYKASVMKFDGSTWIQVGSASFSEGQADFTSIAFDSSDTPYVVYQDSGNSSKASVMKFDGSAWVQVGSAGFSAGQSDYTSIAIDSSGTPYVTYQDGGNGFKASVMKFNGTEWVQVGSAGFSAGLIFYSSIALDNAGTPYVVYRDGPNANKVSVMKFNSDTTLSGTPTNDDVGEHTINLILSDGVNEVEHNFTITVSNVNDAPTSGNLTLSIDEDTSKTFSNTAFVFNDVDLGSSLDSISITRLPTKGSLKLNDTDVVLNQQINVSDLENLVFLPVLNAYGTAYDNFGFKVNDGESTSSEYTATINVTAIDDAPTLSSITTQNIQEDAGDFNIVFTSNDEEGDPISYSVTSSDTSKATVNIVGGEIVVTPLENAFGTINIELNATANSKTTSKNFSVEIAGVNDAPSIDTTFNTKTILEDSGIVNFEINVSDVDGDELDLSVSSSDDSILSVSTNWDTLTQSNYNDTLNFNLRTQSDANGAVIVTVTLVDENDVRVSKSFNVNVTAVNDAPRFSNISNIVVYKNSHEQNISLGINDVDDTELSCSATSTNSSIIKSISCIENQLSIEPISDISGNAEINVSVSDGEYNVSKVFNYKIVPLEDGEDLRTDDINVSENNGSVKTTLNIDDNLSIVTNEINSSAVSHEVIVDGTITKATSEINGSVVEFTASGVHTKYEDSIAHIVAEVNASAIGRSTHSLDLNGTKTQAISEILGAETLIRMIDELIEILTTVTTIVDDHNVSFEVLALQNGNAQHTVKVDGKTSKALCKIAGANTMVKADNSIQTTAKSGDNEAVVITKDDGTSTIEFHEGNVTIDLLPVNSSFEADSNVTIDEVNGTIQMIVESPLTKPLQM